MLDLEAGAPDQPGVRDPERFNGHRVRLRVFEGPLDLLLYLIRAHRYDIFDIPVREVTEQFVDFLVLMNEVDLEYAGDFLVTAATLMQIKSRMLLPPQESANEEVLEEDEDPRQGLVERLLEYQRFQGAAETLKELGEGRAHLFNRPPFPDKDASPDDAAEAIDTLLLRDISTFDLLRAFQKVLDRVQEQPLVVVRREPFTLAERQRALLRRVSGDGATFAILCDDCQSRLEVVITFLAVLELIRRGRIEVTQDHLFDEIWVKASH